LLQSNSAHYVQIIVNKARILSEQIASKPYSHTSFNRIKKNAEGCNPSNFMQNWRAVYAKHGDDFFDRRLSWDEYDETDLKKNIEEESATVPDWAELLSEVIEKFPAALEFEEQSSYLKQFQFDQEPLVTFPLFWFPCLIIGRQKLQERVNDISSLVSKEVIHSIEKQLLSELSRLGELALYEHFCQFRQTRTVMQFKNQDYLLKQFCENLLSDRKLSFLIQYPVLARHISIILKNWLIMYENLFTRLKKDCKEIAACFNHDNKPGMVRSIQLNLSDRHNDGQRIVILHFKEFKLVYKPRTVSQEYAYNQFLFWFKKSGFNYPLPIYQVLKGDDYGWVEYIQASPCQTKSQVVNYFHKAGALLAIAYLLNDNDCHMENLVATADGPVLIDVETALQPEFDIESNKQGAFFKAKKQLQASILKSGLLQFLQKSNDGQWRDASGLRGDGGDQLFNKQRLWRAINTDMMQLKHGESVSSPMQNQLYYQDEKQDVKNYVEELVQGFSTCHEFIEKHKKQLLADESPLNSFKQTSVRIIFRPSNDYAFFLYALAVPRHQKNGMSRSLKIESLATVFAKEQKRPILWPLLKEEQASLENLDIPVFRIDANSLDMVSKDGEKVIGLIRNTSYEQLLTRLKSWNRSDQYRQIELIRSVLILPSSSDIHNADELTFHNRLPQSDLSQEDLVSIIQTTAQDIVDKAIIGDDNAITWLAASYIRQEENKSGGDSYYLYAGATGISLFLAAMFYYSKNHQYRQYVEQACLPVSKVINSPIRDRLLEQEPIGIANGLGSVIYAFVCISNWLNDASYIEQAERLAELIDEDRIANDQRYDIEGGSAGAILSLLTLYHVTQKSTYIHRAELCAKHLAKQAIPQAQGCAWPNGEGLFLAGYAHGVAGISMALMRLYKLNGNQRWYNLALEAIAYEDSIFSSPKKNWPVLTKKADNVDASIIMNTWCHGAPGIALSRYNMIENNKNEKLKKDFQLALESLLKTPQTPIDHLCCGNLGRSDILLTLGIKAKQQNLIKLAKQRVSDVVHYHKQTSLWGLHLKKADNLCFEPGFFRGTSGISYSLLRVIDPVSFHSVLSFDLPSNLNN